MKARAHDHLSERNSSDLANGVKVVHENFSLVESGAFYDYPDVVELEEVERAMVYKSTVYLVPESQESRFSRPRDGSLRGRIWSFRENCYHNTSATGITRSVMFTLMGIPLSVSPVQYLGITMLTVGATTTGALLLSNTLFSQKVHKVREELNAYPSVKLLEGVVTVKVPYLEFEWSSALVECSTVVIRLKKLLEAGAPAAEIEHELETLSASESSEDHE